MLDALFKTRISNDFRPGFFDGPCATGRNEFPRVSPVQRNAALLLVAALAFLTGCASIKPNKGGKAGFTSSAPGQTNEFTIQQPDNPAATASQNYRTTFEEISVTPAGTITEERVTSVDLQGSTNFTQRTITTPAPQTNTTRKVIEAVASIGPAQKDNSRELKAAFDNMRPVQWIGIVLVLVAAAFLYFKWWTPALIAGGFGIGMVVLSHAIVGNEQIVLLVLGCALVILFVFRSYERGQLDRFLPDSLDKNPNPKGTRENT